MTDTMNIEKRQAASERAERTRNGQTYIPAVDIIEKPEELLLLADVPGATADDIDIHYDRGELTIAARVAARQPDDLRFLLREYGVGDFVRTFQIGEGIDADKIEAEVKDGVLRLHLPKAESAKTRKIAVKSQ